MDNTTEMCLSLLREMLANEPEQDAGQNPSLGVHERVGEKWAEWDRQVSGLRLVVGIRLTANALDAPKGTP